MNLKLIGKILGKIMILEGVLMILPLIVSIVYKEYQVSIWYPLAFVITIISLVAIGSYLQTLKSDRKGLYQREGFAVCALVWIIMTVFGALPFVINGDIPNYIDAMFETMSGFTTTGASVVDDLTILSHSTLFWRSFTHWIGGMGILVFILIFIPESNDGSSLHLLKAESPGPIVGKLASKMKVTTRILYLIYFGLTVIQVILLSFSPAGVAPDGTVYEMDLFYNLLTTFGTAGTGGFGFVPGSMEYFSPYAQYVTSIFLILFGINFSLYYLILIGKAKEVFKSEELRSYFLIIFVAIVLIFTNIISNTINSLTELTPSLFEETFRHSLFQVASIITTCGYSTTDFNLWPALSQIVIIILMFSGAMAGSTGGGMKVSRLVMAVKGVGIKIRKLINPRYVVKTKMEGKILEENTINDVFSFITMYLVILFTVIVLLSFDTNVVSHLKILETKALENKGLSKEAIDLALATYNPSGDVFTTNFTATLSAISNIGPGLAGVGPYYSFSFYSPLSKVLLTFTMLIGRLEILPVLILFHPNTWKK